MMLHNYSQLPVINGPKTVIGFISWESIGYALSNGCESDDVKNYINPDVTLLSYETPLLEAISVVIEKEFVVVYKNDKTISGIVTLADISSQFFHITEPFILLEQIENHIRQLLNKKFLIDDLREFCKIDNTERKIEFIDDLTFGDYLRILSNQGNWDKLNLSLERVHFIKQLDKIRMIRNDIMHFDPDGITAEQRNDLIKMAKFLMQLRKHN